MVICKYPIEIADEQVVDMPIDYELLHAGLDPTGQPCVWALVDKGSEMAQLHLRVAGTGHEVSHDHLHVGTFVQGPFVWHVFEKFTD